MSLPPQQLPPHPHAVESGYPGADNHSLDAGDAPINVRRYFAAVWRQRLLVVALGLVGLAGGVGLTLVVKPEYEAQASIQIPTAPRGFAAANPLRSAPLFEGRGWMELLQSFEVLDDVVRRRTLFLEHSNPADSAIFAGFALGERFAPGGYRVAQGESGRVLLLSASGDVLDERAVGDSLGRDLGFAWVPGSLGERASVAFTVRAPRDASVKLGRDLNVQLPPDGAILKIALRGLDPVSTAQTVNVVAERFVDVANTLKREKLSTVTEVLREQLERARVDLATAEAALEQFKVNTITLPNDRGATPIASGLAETRDPVRQAFFRLLLDREDLARDRDAIRRAMSAVEDSARSIVVSLGTIRAVRESQELSASLTELTAKRAEARQMRVAFSSAHPPLRQLEREIEEIERRTIPSQVDALLRNLEARIGDFDQRIAASAREMQQIPVRSTEEGRRERDVEIKQIIYTELQSAYEQARLSELSAAPDVRLLDSAVPPTRPTRDRMLVIVVGGALFGVALGVGLAVVRDRFDPKLRYPEQVTHELGLPILGAIPLVRHKGRSAADDRDALIEAMRGARMAMLYSHGTAGPFVTTVTSPGSGDGKSFVSLHLARSFAMSGRRTLLIDGDNRRGLLHRAAGVPRRPGLIDILEGSATRTEVTHRLPAEGFDFLPAGSHRRSAPELLASAEMARLMMDLRADYQAIVIDSPPLGAGIDPLALASLSGTLVMVLRNGSTDRALAEARLIDIGRLPIRVLGALLNDVRTEGAYRYYAYLPGYRTSDEADGNGDDATVPRPRVFGLRSGSPG